MLHSCVWCGEVTRNLNQNHKTTNTQQPFHRALWGKISSSSKLMIDLTLAKFGRKVARRIGQKRHAQRRVVSAISLSHLRPLAREKVPGQRPQRWRRRTRKVLWLLCAANMNVRPSARCDAGASCHLFIFTFLRTRSLGLWSEPDLTQTNSLTRRPRLLINLIGSGALIDEFN